MTLLDEPVKINAKKIEFYLEKKGVSLPPNIKKRNGDVVRFDLTRIGNAIQSCFNACEVAPLAAVDEVVTKTANILAAKFGTAQASVEEVQDAVEYALLSVGEIEAARTFIVYREHHAEERKLRPIPDDVKAAFEADDKYFPTQLQRFQFFDKYSRFNYDLGRRETWIETVTRSVDFLRELSFDKLDNEVYDRIHDAILNMRVMPSMRLLAMAGEAARRNNLAIFNCSYIPVSDINAFVETLIISMSGCGVGYSVEREYVEQFPRIKRQKKHQEIPLHFVEDSTEGWAEAYRLGLEAWFDGRDINYDFSLVREAGMVLRIKGGRASGPGPLKSMLHHAREIILARQGSYLRTIDAHDIQCHTGEAAVSGGVRRTSLIALFDPDDQDMVNCKNGFELVNNPQRHNSNNSAVWPENISSIQITQQMIDMARGKRGEPGIFSRYNAVKQKPKRRKKADFGTNPCGEINLRPYGLCNLSAAVARPDDTPETLLEKVEIATIIGTIQSMATHFPGLRDKWRENAEEERLLGVDVTGQMDCPAVQNPDVMDALREHAVATNIIYADQLGINQSAGVTCVKPGGNSSAFLDCASGQTRRQFKFGIRRARVSAHTPIYRVLKSAGVLMKPENGQDAQNATTWVIAFPIKSPEASKIKQRGTAIEQCEYWLMNKLHYTEHNPSCTITYDEDEIIDLTKWVWDHRELIGGLSFLPNEDMQYEQAPYEETTEEEYERLAAAFPVIDFSKLYRYELEDYTTAASELACFAGACDA